MATTKTFELSGNTFPVRDVIAKLGATWDKQRKVWTVTGRVGAVNSNLDGQLHWLRKQGVAVKEV